MATTINLTTTLRVTGDVTVETPQSSKQITMTGTHHGAQGQTLGATAEAINLPPDVATLGVCWFKNQSSTNTISLGVLVGSTFYPFGKLKAGEVYPLRLHPDCVPYALCPDSGGAVLYHLELED